MNIKVGMGTYSLLRNRADGSASNEELAVQAAIERGMERYWSHWFDITAKEYERLRKRHSQCQRDNELLRGLMDQNRELRQIVESAGGPV